MREHEGELHRIGHNGISQPADLTLAMKACCMVAGELTFRRMEEEKNDG
jgi:aspartate aminotransferase-like enzyme